ncbi:carboxypeptidase regulatory-like domain-containing protein [Parapedobacter sp. DT-150]|uniref:TonB-dependent receptor n=1 Tax=Parapedobacter sp. DT-150 TaxID=3396162 RepID=UPI003F1D7C1C
MSRLTFLVAVITMSFAGISLASDAKSQGIESVKVTIDRDDAVLKDILTELTEASGFTFVYKEEIGDKEGVTVRAANRSLREVLERIGRENGLEFIPSGYLVAVRLAPEPQPPGWVSGRVMDNRGQPMPGASVRIAETGRGVQSEADGSFSVPLPMGTYTVEASFLGYQPRRITDVTVKAGQTTPLDIVLTAATEELAAVTVTADYRRASIEGLYARQKNASAVTDGISADQIAVTPDNNAAQVLKRVNGLTIQEDKFVTVRGLSDRYNNVMLNGAGMTSTEPNRRNFAFDIIPSGLIDNIVVNKTATPDMPSEFAGGLVQINTRDVPDRDHLSLTVGSGVNNRSWGGTLLSTPRGDRDYLGYDDGNRQWWRNTWDRFEYAGAMAAGDAEHMAEMNRRIPNNWGLHEYTYRPAQNYQLLGGKRIGLRQAGTIGITLGATYRHDERIDTEMRRTYADENYDFNGNAFHFRSILGGTLNVAWQQGSNKIVLRNVYTHVFDNESNSFAGPLTGYGSGDAAGYISVTLINDIWQRRLEGEHRLGSRGIRIDWSGDWVSTVRDQPDTRSSLGFRQPNDPEGYAQYVVFDNTGFLGNGLSIFNSRLEETKFNWAGNATYPFMVAGRQQQFKVGYAGSRRQADFGSIGLLAVAGGNQVAFDEAAFGLADYELLTSDFIYPGGIYYTPSGAALTSAAGDDYTGTQYLHAGYLMLDALLSRNLRLTGGMRLENNRQDISNVTYQRATGLAVDSVVHYDRTDWLPSVNLIYSLTRGSNFRLAYSKTLSRADFRERSPFMYYDFRDRTVLKGATSVKDASINNFDVRYELYPAPGEVFSVSVFYKRFESPVELVASQSSSGLIYYYFNLSSSISRGVEMDFRKSLGFIHPASGWLSDLYISGNASLMASDVRYNTSALLDAAGGVSNPDSDALPPDSRNRPLQGLSPYTVNAGIGYFGRVFGINANYNRYGRRIVVGGLYPFQDQYETPRDVIDLQVSGKLMKQRMEIRFNIADLLQQPYRVYDNVSTNDAGNILVDNETRKLENPNDDPKGKHYNPDLDFLRYEAFRGMNFSLNITYRF